MRDSNYTIPNVVICYDPIGDAAKRAAASVAKGEKVDPADVNVILEEWKKTMANFEANLPSNLKKKKRK